MTDQRREKLITHKNFKTYNIMNFLNFLIYVQKTAETAYNNEHNPLDDMRNSGFNVHFEYYTQSSDFFLRENTDAVISEELSIDAGNTIFVLLDNSDAENENRKVVLFFGGWRVCSSGFSKTRLYE